MLNKYDIEFMKNSVRDIIDMWNTTITILQPLPSDKQPNYDNILHEYSGDMLYESIMIQADRKDIVNNMTNSMYPDEAIYGDRNAGVILYAIPNVIPVYDDNNVQIGIKPFKPHPESIVIIDDSDDRYHIVSMRDRIGETLILLNRYVGSVPKGTKIISEDLIPVDGLGD